jgi:circadian clock protein KaiC
MLIDGYWTGASTLVAGPSGAGKTLMGLHFVFAGARLGEPSLIATVQESPVQLEYICQGFGWSLRHDNVEVMYRTPVDVYIDEWVHDVLGIVERSGTKRLMIDSLGDLMAAAGDGIRFREYVYSLLQRLSRAIAKRALWCPLWFANRPGNSANSYYAIREPSPFRRYGTITA